MQGVSSKSCVAQCGWSLSEGEQGATGGFYGRKRHEFAFVLIDILTVSHNSNYSDQ